MTRVGIHLSIVFLSALPAFVASAGADTTNEIPDFKEVYDLVRSHLVGVTDAGLNRDAVDGLLEQLRGRVYIAGRESDSAATNALLASPAIVLDDGVAYARIGRVANGLADEINRIWRRLVATNELKGLVLDLRYAGGTDYQAAADTADLFATKEQPLLDWGQGMVRSKPKSDAIKLPVAVLVNRQTGGAAEALAAVLREMGVGLILGGKTAGTAMITREFPLKSGQRLFIAVKPVKLENGAELSPGGVGPDIEVTVSPQAERAFFDDAYATIAAAMPIPSDAAFFQPNETNRASRRQRLSEADLVRERREGTTNLDGDVPAGTERKPEKPVVRDPVLARAIDLLKGLAVVRGSRF